MIMKIDTFRHSLLYHGDVVSGKSLYNDFKQA